MRTRIALFVCLGALLAVAVDPIPLLADDGSGSTPRRVVPLGAPPAPRMVPVPDVRGLDEAAARRALSEAGLRLGGVERVTSDRLQAELGTTYAVGTVVQQAPRPSSGEQPSWLARGAQVWLRVASTRDEGLVRPRTPTVPVAPRTTGAPLGTMPRYAGRSPVPPPPALPGTGGPTVTTQPPIVVQPPTVVQPPIAQPPVVQQPPVVEQPPFAEPDRTAPEQFVAMDIRRRVGLPCERGGERFHLRPVGGAAFWLGDDEGDVDIYAGIDVGYTFASCFGVDVFYRYSAGTFDTQVVAGLLEDSGVFHHVGVKGTYMASLDNSGQLFFWAGLGVAYFWTSDLTIDDDGVSAFAELGLGYALSDAIRVRVGLNLHAMDTESGRFLTTDDARVLWTLAPSIGLELDL
ncbi:MAG: PASTA domain-containing protein [Planctomycetota bacterium]|nr:PASTA domain-containing protein [Planctomycetota bacterium]